MNIFVKSERRNNERNFNEAEKPATNNWQPIERLVSHDPDTCLITDMIQKALKDVLWLADIANLKSFVLSEPFGATTAVYSPAKFRPRVFENHVAQRIAERVVVLVQDEGVVGLVAIVGSGKTLQTGQRRRRALGGSRHGRSAERNEEKHG